MPYMTCDLKPCEPMRVLYASKMYKKYPDFLSFPDKMNRSRCKHRMTEHVKASDKKIISVFRKFTNKMPFGEWKRLAIRTLINQPYMRCTMKSEANKTLKQFQWVIQSLEKHKLEIIQDECAMPLIERRKLLHELWTTNRLHITLSAVIDPITHT